MSDDEAQIVHTEDGQMLTAEYRDGQLQIVEVTAFDKGNQGLLLSDLSTSDETRYVQVVDGDKGLLHLDLLSLIKCSDADGSSTYQLVGASGDEGDTTLTCVLQDAEQEESEDSYVVLNTEQGKEPLVYLQSSLQQIHTQQSLRNNDTKKKPLTTEEILAKAKLLQKARSLEAGGCRSQGGGRKRRAPLPAPLELLSSPGFKLYLYSCKLCSFKCNAMQEMSAHKAREHAAGRGDRGAGSGRSAGAPLQCARCPYRATQPSQLMSHVSTKHAENSNQNDETEFILGDCNSVDVLVCGACGFESRSGSIFKKHVDSAHSVTSHNTTAAICLEDDASDSN